LCLDHLYDLYSSPTRHWLKQLFKDPQPIAAGLTLFRPLSPREAAWPARINLSPALVVRDRYLHLLVRRVTAAVRAGDSNSIDASVAATLPSARSRHDDHPRQSSLEMYDRFRDQELVRCWLH
jgi:hypothetical protein